MFGLHTKTLTCEELDQSNTGWSIPAEGQEQAELQKALLLSQSQRIAKRLEKSGHKLMSDVLLSVVGLGSCMVEKTKEFKNSNILPHIQSKNVHQMLLDLSYWLDQQPKRQLRMWVVSNGFVSLDNYRDSHKEFTRKISRFAAEPFLKENGIEIFYYNIENTIQETYEGTPIRMAMLNQHSHLVVKTTRKLGAATWRKVLSFARNYFPKGYMKDAGSIKKAAECVKYVFKPAEFEKLTDSELGQVYEATKGLRFFIPLSSFKRFRCDLKKQNLKVKKKLKQNGFDWVFVEKASREAREESSGSNENQVVAITHPSPRFTSITEPCVVVRNMTCTPEELIERLPFLQERRQKTLELIEKRRRQAEKISVAYSSIRDTTTTTVRSQKAYDDVGGFYNPPPDRKGGEYVTTN